LAETKNEVSCNESAEILAYFSQEVKKITHILVQSQMTKKKKTALFFDFSVGALVVMC